MPPKNYLDQYDNGNPDTLSGNEIREEQLDELAGLVGEVLFRFNSLESDLDEIIAEAVNDRSHQSGYAITAELGPVFTKKILVFKALYGPVLGDIGNDELKKKFESIYGQLFKIKDVRNDVAHADWLAASDSYEVRLRISTDDGGAYSIRKMMPPDFLNAQIAELEKVADALSEFKEAFESTMTG